MGRFLTTDPVAAAITDPHVANYAYAMNRPCTVTDPSGRENCWIGAVGGGLILGALAPLHLALALAAVPAAPTVAGEYAILYAEGVAIYITGQAIALIKESASRPCSEVELSVNPLDAFMPSHEKTHSRAFTERIWQVRALAAIVIYLVTYDLARRYLAALVRARRIGVTLFGALWGLVVGALPIWMATVGGVEIEAWLIALTMAILFFGVLISAQLLGKRLMGQ